MNLDIARELLAFIDPASALRPAGESDPCEAASRFIGALRHRQSPVTGFTPAIVQRVREQADAAQLQAAKAAVEAVFEEPLVATAHTNAIAQRGSLKLMLALDAELSERIGRHVLESRELWEVGPWGATRSIGDVLRVMMAVPEVENGDLAPLFCWLNHQLWKEWEWARTWGETMLGSSGHNWWLHTFIGFWQAGLLFPEFKGFGRFASLAPTYFEHEMRLLMERDGFTKERSGYHWGTVRHWLHAWELARANGIDFSPEFTGLLRQCGETIWQSMTPNAFIPCFGDCAARHSAGSTTELRQTAALLGIPQAKAVAEALEPTWQPPMGMLLFEGRDLLPAYRRLESILPPLDAALHQSGFFFMRSDWSPKADYLAVQAGTIGSVVSSHAHTDMFTFELYSGGRPVVIDNCSGPYGKEAARHWRVASASHNVATVDAADHLAIQDEWRWKGMLTPHVNAWISADRYAYLSTVHEGYRSLPEPVTAVRRKIFYLRGEYAIVIDRFTPESGAEHLYTLHFHINGDCDLGDNGRLITKDTGGNVTIVPVPGLDGAAAIEACPHPLEGYDNPRHLTYSRRAAGKQLFVTILVPFEGAAAPAVTVASAAIACDGRELALHEATGLRIEIDGRTDWYLDQHMQWNLPWSMGPHSGDGRLFHSQTQLR